MPLTLSMACRYVVPLSARQAVGSEDLCPTPTEPIRTGTMALRDTRLAGVFYALLDRWLVVRLQRAGLRPSQVTLLGLGLAFLVPLGFWLHPAVGALLMMSSGLADAADGNLARRTGQSSPWGAFLDSCLDRVSDFCYLAGIWVVFWHDTHPRAATSLVLLALLCSQMISYTKARAEALGVACPGGWMERGLRTVYLVVWAWLLVSMPSQRQALLWGGVLLYTVLALFTAIQRVRIVRAGFRRQAAGDDRN